MKCGLLGCPLGHSYSPAIHAMLGDYSYSLFEKSREELADFLKNGDFSGLNVTIPYKKAVVPYMHELTEAARKLGAVNTIVRRADGTLLGHNSDLYGFRFLLAQSKLNPQGKKCLVLGSGGASSTVCAVLEEAGGQVVVISRSGKNNYRNLHLHKDASILVNATPVGMYPENGVSPVDLSLFPRLEGVLDLIYNPARTKLLMDAENRGIVAVNGLGMLVAQAKESGEYFTNMPVSPDEIERILCILQNKMQNIILIGMPGCGKTTVAEALARYTGRKWVDIDREIEKAAGKSIPAIFAQDGEDTFRRLETEILAGICKESALVIATGGGCVTKEENHPLLRQNGRLFWLQRDLDKLPTDGRPLSLSEGPKALFQRRAPLYARLADHIIDNNGTIADTVNQILSAMEVV